MNRLLLPLGIATVMGLGLALFPHGAFAAQPCLGTINGGAINDSLTVGDSVTCVLNGVQVNGNVQVTGGGRLFINGSNINGDVLVNTTGVFWVCSLGQTASSIRGNVTVTSARVAQIGGTDTTATPNDGDNNPVISGALCGAGERIGSSVQMSGVTVRAEMDSARVNGPVQFTNNAAVEVESNVINGGLQCSNNGSVTNDGRKNVVAGGGSGQCAGL